MSDYNDNPYAVDNFSGNDYGHVNAPPPNVPDYLIPSILMTLFCCQILGIIAIVFSAMASSEKSTGNYQNALNYANNAKICLIIGLVGGLLIGLCMAAFIVLPVVLGGIQ